MQNGILDLGEVVGPQGPQGIPGNTGPAGQNGLQGAAGTMLYPVTVSTLNAPLGARAGDFMLSSASVNIAIGNISSVVPGTLCEIVTINPFELVTAGTLRGPTGAQGATGNTGPQGPVGPMGEAPNNVITDVRWSTSTTNPTLIFTRAAGNIELAGIITRAVADVSLAGYNITSNSGIDFDIMPISIRVGDAGGTFQVNFMLYGPVTANIATTVNLLTVGRQSISLSPIMGIVRSFTAGQQYMSLLPVAAGLGNGVSFRAGGALQVNDVVTICGCSWVVS